MRQNWQNWDYWSIWHLEQKPRRKCVAIQDDVVRRVQPKCDVKIPTSYKDLDDPVISRDPSSLLAQERRTLSARESVSSNMRTRRSTAPAPATPIIMIRTTRLS
jgi:hypothetical protein